MFVVLATGGSVWLLAQGPQPAFGQVLVSPPNIVFNTPTPVTFTIKIDTPTLNPATVELQRVNASGNFLGSVGRMLDNGKSGDAVADDKIFTARVTLNVPEVGKSYFRVSVAFRGVKQNAVSAPISLDVDPFKLPPDPGGAGKLTLEGIDSDNDGVRDDVQRWIGLNQPSEVRPAFGQYASSLEKILQSSAVPSQLRNAWGKLISATRCLAYVGGLDQLRINIATVKAQMLNTRERSRAYLLATDLERAPTDDPDDLSVFCTAGQP